MYRIYKKKTKNYPINVDQKCETDPNEHKLAIGKNKLMQYFLKQYGAEEIYDTNIPNSLKKCCKNVYIVQCARKKAYLNCTTEVSGKHYLSGKNI